MCKLFASNISSVKACQKIASSEVKNWLLLFVTNASFTRVTSRSPGFCFELEDIVNSPTEHLHHPWPLQATMVVGGFIPDEKLPLVFATLIIVLTTITFSVKAPAQSQWAIPYNSFSLLGHKTKYFDFYFKYFEVNWMVFCWSQNGTFFTAEGTLTPCFCKKTPTN